MILTEEFAPCRIAANSSGDRIDVGGGFYVMDKTGPRDGEWLDWRIYDENRDKEKEDYCGYMSVRVHAEWDNLPSIHEIKIDSKYRGMGLGEKMARAFIERHGVLASDTGGDTSMAAARMWERMGAQKVRCDASLTGYFYILRK